MEVIQFKWAVRALLPSDWCPYKKRTFGHRERPWGCTEEGPCEETAGGGGWPSANQGQGLQKKPTWQGARCNLTLTFQPPEP